MGITDGRRGPEDLRPEISHTELLLRTGLVDREVTLHRGSGVVQTPLCHLPGWVSGSFCLCYFELAPTSLVFPGMPASGWANQGPLETFQFFPAFLEKQPSPLIISPTLTGQGEHLGNEMLSRLEEDPNSRPKTALGPGMEWPSFCVCNKGADGGLLGCCGQAVSLFSVYVYRHTRNVHARKLKVNSWEPTSPSTRGQTLDIGSVASARPSHQLTVGGVAKLSKCPEQGGTQLELQCSGN